MNMKVRWFLASAFALALTWSFFLQADERLAEILSRPNTLRAVSPVEGFAVYDGDWKVQSDGVLDVNRVPGAKLILEGEAQNQGEVSVRMYLPSGPQAANGNGAILTNVSRAGVGADAFDGFEIGFFPPAQPDAKGTLVIGRHQQNFQSLHRIPCEVPVDQWFTATVRFTPERLVVSLNGKQVGDFTLPPEVQLAPGQVGVRAWLSAMRFRDFQLNQKAVPFRAASVQQLPWPKTLETADLPSVLFIKRAPLSRPYSVGLDMWQPQPYFPGCAICRMEPSQPNAPVQTLFSDPDGCIYDMNLSLDAKTIYFSYRKMSDPHWHLWRMNLDGSGLKQLTDGNYYDVSPCELPDGTLVFVSTRHFGHTVCQPGPASNLFRLRLKGLDGSELETPRIEYLSMNTLSDLSPQLLQDGRVLFTRWEYIDRDLTFRQSLWTQNPDGTAYQLFFGNTVRDVGTFWQARQLPGCTDQVVATFAPHHGFPHGAIGIVDRSHGVEAPKNVGFTYITKEFPTIGDSAHEWSYRDPFPLSDERFLCSFGGTTEKDPENKYRLYLLNRDGEKRLLYDDEKFSCYFPIPVLPNAGWDEAPVTVADRVAPIPWKEGQAFDSTETGSVSLMDVYEGLPETIARGSVAKIRVLEQVRKAEDLRERAYDQSPLMGYGTYYAKRYWGSAKVDEDGSAHFQVPAMREIYFQIVDAEGKELHRMTSAVQVMPGESVSCIGCHEDRDTTFQPMAPPTALRRPADVLELDVPGLVKDTTTANPSGLVDYQVLVQPVLDRHCVECHSGADPAGGYDLTGDKTRFFTMSYDNLLGRSRSYRQHDMQSGEMLPEERAKGKPLVHFFWLLWTPTGQHIPLEGGTAQSRLPDYLTQEHCGHPIPAEDRERVCFWIDANVPFYSTYGGPRPNSFGQRDRYADKGAPDRAFSKWFAEDFCEVYSHRCAECHFRFWEQTQAPTGNPQTDWNGAYAQLNLTHPEKSPALTAHLPKEQGGRGISIRRDKQEFLFPNTQDVDYLKMLRAIQKGAEMNADGP